jgi:hypothetical protein
MNPEHAASGQGVWDDYENGEAGTDRERPHGILLSCLTELNRQYAFSPGRPRAGHPVS